MHLQVSTFFLRELLKAPIVHFKRCFHFSVTSPLEWTLHELDSVVFLAKRFELTIYLSRASFELFETVERVCSSRGFIVMLAVSKILYVWSNCLCASFF
jgi:hypothetical protein